MKPAPPVTIAVVTRPSITAAQPFSIVARAATSPE